MMTNGSSSEDALVFCYGTLKRGEPNHWVMEQIEADQFVEFIGDGLTLRNIPLVIATKYNIPFLLNEEGKGEVSKSKGCV